MIALYLSLAWTIISTWTLMEANGYGYNNAGSYGYSHQQPGSYGYAPVVPPVNNYYPSYTGQRPYYGSHYGGYPGGAIGHAGYGQSYGYGSSGLLGSGQDNTLLLGAALFGGILLGKMLSDKDDRRKRDVSAASETGDGEILDHFKDARLYNYIMNLEEEMQHRKT